MKKILLCFFTFLLTTFIYGQAPTFTANEVIPPFDAVFEWGAHLGADPNWSDENLGDIAAGNENLNLKGIGLNSIRIAIPESLVESDGYDVKKMAFQHFQSLGLEHVVINLGGPIADHVDPTMYCPGKQPKAFKNIFAPIWDGGLNGTPVNDTNYFARYCYLMAENYKDRVNIWEVLFDVDVDLNGTGWSEPGDQGNWWDANPDPCEIEFGAPVSHYVRMLRIAYEVIKSVDSDQLITTGGIRHPSFLHAILNTTDNPIDGTLTSAYPNFGGAYFDILGFQNYPNQDSSLRYWDEGLQSFVQKRHSDAAVLGFVQLQESFVTVLEQNGYDGQQFPSKYLINSGTNIPRKAFTETLLFGAEAQKNYVMKSAVAGFKSGLKQMQFYGLTEKELLDDASNEREVMGFYEALTSNYPDATLTDAGLGMQTLITFMKGYTYDADLTEQMELPTQMDGGAFTRPGEKPLFVIWAKTWRDSSEAGEFIYQFPSGFEIKELLCYEWNFNHTGIIQVLLPDYVHTPSSPIFLIPEYLSDTEEITAEEFKIYPNPARDELMVQFENSHSGPAALILYNGLGSASKVVEVSPGQTSFSFEVGDLPDGIYMLQLKKLNSIFSKKVVLKR
ncbi:MAG: T9SS type A sorting domain-containing protein [Saprospiraceae bacterium]|nr:T9SS type A sorting domain-containing protein [Saprospiraceae bacterium]